MGISSRLWKIGWMLLLIPWMRLCLDTRFVLSHELVSRDMQEASLPYPTLTPPEKKRQKKRERKFKQWQINPPKICGTSTGFLPMASVLVLQVCDQLNYEDPYIRSRPICWVHLNPWKEWNIKLQLPLRRSYLHIKCVFPLFTSSFCVSFLSRVKMNSTN